MADLKSRFTAPGLKAAPPQAPRDESAPVLRLLHLSDIHFRGLTAGHEGNLDLEHAVRTKMALDISLLRDALGPMDALLVVGDIAFSGQPTEYKAAEDFLHGVTERIGCPTDKIICVPGNHDVDWTQHDLHHEALRLELRTLAPDALSDKLQELLSTPETCETLLKPFAGYNSFALAYSCDVSHDAPVWGPKTFSLGSRTVQVHGVNSAWISNGDDANTQDHHRLVAGAFQAAAIAAEPDVISVVMCHHPMGWLRDGVVLSPWLDQAQLVLTGHEHAAGIDLAPDHKTLHVASGAVNPVRAEAPWIPAYNVLELWFEPDGQQELQVDVYTETWQRRAGFGPDPSCPQPRHFRLDIAPRSADEIVGAKRIEGEPAVAQPPEPIDSSRHRHAYAVMCAPPDLRRSVAREMGLDIDPSLRGLEADRSILQQAIRTGQLPELAADLLGGMPDDAG